MMEKVRTRARTTPKATRRVTRRVTRKMTARERRKRVMMTKATINDPSLLDFMRQFYLSLFLLHILPSS